MNNKPVEYIHVRSLEKYHPGYKDRELKWAKIYFRMVQGDPDCELIDNEIDFARLIKLIILELDAQKPLPNLDSYWVKKGFDIKNRPMSLTLKMLHNFLDVDTQLSKLCGLEIEEDKEKMSVTQLCVTEQNPSLPAKDKKEKIKDYVFLRQGELEKLYAALGKAVTDELIENLDDYIGINPGVRSRKYKEHYRVILSWHKNNLKKDGSPKFEPGRNQL